MTKLDSILKSRDITWPTKIHIVSQSYGFSSSHVRMWELGYKERRAPKNWCFWTVVLEKTLESRLDCNEIKPVHPTGNKPWICTGRTDNETEAPILWPPDVKSRLIGKDPYTGKDWWQEEKGVTEMFGWHCQLHGHEFEQTLGDSEGQGRLACCSPWGLKELAMTKGLNNHKCICRLQGNISLVLFGGLSLALDFSEF